MKMTTMKFEWFPSGSVLFNICKTIEHSKAVDKKMIENAKKYPLLEAETKEAISSGLGSENKFEQLARKFEQDTSNGKYIDTKQALTEIETELDKHNRMLEEKNDN